LDRDFWVRGAGASAERVWARRLVSVEVRLDSCFASCSSSAMSRFICSNSAAETLSPSGVVSRPARCRRLGAGSTSAPTAA
jgi:hypothetical protein